MNSLVRKPSGCAPSRSANLSRRTSTHRNRWALFHGMTDLYGAFPVKGLFPRWLGSRSADCSLGFAHSSLFGAGKAVLRPVACYQVRGARGRGQGTETLAQLGGLPPERAEGR